MNLAYECLEKNAQRIPDRPAVIDGVHGIVRSYAELNAQVNSAANALQSLGVEKGDRVALYLRNIPEFIVAFFAAAKVGAIAVPFNIMLKKMEIEYILNHCAAKIVIGMTEETDENILPIWANLPTLERIISVQGLAGGGKNPGILSFEDLVSQHKSDSPHWMSTRKTVSRCSTLPAPLESPRGLCQLMGAGWLKLSLTPPASCP